MGTKIFFGNAWDLSGESETAEKKSEIVCESVELAKTIYNVYAVASDCGSIMVKMGNMLKDKIWHITCNSDIVNLSAILLAFSTNSNKLI